MLTSIRLGLKWYLHWVSFDFSSLSLSSISLTRVTKYIFTHAQIRQPDCEQLNSHLSNFVASFPT